MLGLKSPVADIAGAGPSTVAKLKRLKIETVADLLSHYPARHEDLRRVVKIRDLRSNMPSVLRGRLQLIKTRRTWRRRMSLTEGLFEDGTGTVRLVWFNQPYLATTYKPGEELFVVGTLSDGDYGPQIQSPAVERVRDRQLLAGRVLPIYRLTTGLTQRQIRLLIERVIPATLQIPDWLPHAVQQTERLAGLSQSVRDIHFPKDLRALETARQRLKFNELFLFSLAIMQADRHRDNQIADPIPFDETAVREFVQSLPFRLTDGQRKAAWEILRDLQRPRPMYRLLEGDVGSGKTIVAAIAVRNVAKHGRQSAMLAPTEILSQQHYATLQKFFGHSLRIALMTGSQRLWNLNHASPTRAKILQAIRQGDLDLIVGTHALLAEDIEFPKLSCIIIDEQHRFGVEQRHGLTVKGLKTFPHLLSMTATPIPRTLALALYGDLKISQLRELPPGRTPVRTRVLSPNDRDQAFSQIRARAAVGEQAYVVCPLIDESDDLGVAAATEVYERLKQADLNGLRLGLLHGKLSSRAKQAALEDFAARRVDVLVATPVVEVGVDIPNATTMVVEGAERFGLAQLHQLRGRVGRSSKSSTCFLLTTHPDSDTTGRLLLLEKNNDGFALAEEDLGRRGPGDVYGVRQSGLPAFKMASLTDVALMQRVHASAQRLLSLDPGLRKHQPLSKKVASFFATLHAE